MSEVEKKLLSTYTALPLAFLDLVDNTRSGDSGLSE